MTGCSDIEKLLNDYLDGELCESDRLLVEEHMPACADCRRAMGELKKLRALLSGLDDVEPPEGLADQVMSRIHEAEKRQGFWHRFFFPLHIKVPVQALATIFVAALAVYLYKATLPEMGRTDIPLQAPPASAEKTEPKVQTLPPKVKEAQPEKTAPQTPVEKKGSPQKPAAPVPEPPTPREALAPGTVQPEGISGEARPTRPAKTSDRAAIAERNVRDEMALSKSAPLPAPVPVQKAERRKTRGLAGTQEKIVSEGPAASAVVGGAYTYRHTRMTVMADDVPAMVTRIREILKTQGATGIDEKERTGSKTISGWAGAQAITELRKSIPAIAVITDSGGTARKDDGAGPVLLEITITKKDIGEAETPAAK